MNKEIAEKLNAELRVLTSQLANGEYGDWKVIKSYEYYLAGIKMPYDIQELHSQRQAMRDRINEIKVLLKQE